jgi:hypothetical protein
MKSFNQWKENELPMQNDVKHMIGNPIFAIETNIGPLRKRILEGRTEEAIEVLNSIAQSIEQIKEFLVKLN